jgi:hypothetical protein
MSSDKIEPRLREEMARMESTGGGDALTSVIIQVRTYDRPSKDYPGMQTQVDMQQKSVKERLRELGVQGDIRSLVLSNSIEANLTPSQIRAISDHEDVKSIILNRADRVTA